MPATAAPPALSPAAEAVRRSLLALPDEDRAAVLKTVRPSATGLGRESVDRAEIPYVPPEALRELEDDAGGETVTWEEMEAELDRLCATPPKDLPPNLRAAYEAGAADAERARPNT